MLKRRVSYGLLAVLMLLLAAMAWTARDFAKLAAYFPITVATLGVALAFIELGLSRRAVTDPPTAQDDEEDAEFTKHLNGGDRKSTSLNSSHQCRTRMQSSA